MIWIRLLSASHVYLPCGSGNLVYSTAVGKIVFAYAVKNVVPLGARAAPSIGRLKETAGIFV